jgi:hypothetical protein
MRSPEVRSTAAKISSLKTIEGLLDYAILESAELGLPLIVCLLRMARLELETAFVSSPSDHNKLEINLQ